MSRRVIAPTRAFLRHTMRYIVVLCGALALTSLSGSGKPESCDAPTILLLGDMNGHYLASAKTISRVLDTKSSTFALAQFTKNCTINTGQRYVGIGPAAATYLAQNAGEDVEVSFSMIPSIKRAGFGDRVMLKGVTTAVAAREQVDLIRRTLPAANRIGVLYRSSSSASSEAIDEFRAAVSGSIKLVLIDLDTYENVSHGITRLIHEKPDVVWTFPDPSVYSAASVRALLIASIRAKIPVFGFSAGVVRAGALFGIDIDPEAQGEQLAEILNKSSPEERHIETAAIRPVVNFIVAKKIGVQLPPEVVAEAVKSFK